MQVNLVYLLILFISVILHEIAHGYSALYFGDDTAKRAGRLTLDPLAHVDLIGTILVPLFCLFSGAPIFGWAKPVPVDFNSLPNRKAELWVTLSGILINFALAILAAVLIRLLVLSGAQVQAGDSFSAIMISLSVMRINLMLAVFNLMPFPPLDGWRIWGVWLPYEMRMRIESNPGIAMFLLLMLMPYVIGFIVAPLMSIFIRIFLAGV